MLCKWFGAGFRVAVWTGLKGHTHPRERGIVAANRIAQTVSYISNSVLEESEARDRIYVTLTPGRVPTLALSIVITYIYRTRKSR